MTVGESADALGVNQLTRSTTTSTPVAFVLEGEAIAIFSAGAA